MKSEFIKSADIDKKSWDKFVLQSPQGSIFALSDYLDIINPDWAAIVVTNKQGELAAALPMNIKSRFTIKYATQPVLAKYLGLMIEDGSAKTIYNDFHHKSKFAKEILDHIPSAVKYFSYNFSPAFNYPLPFHWAGFKLESKYTYLLDISTTIREIRHHYKNSLRTKLSGFDQAKFIIEIDRNFDDHEKVFDTKFNFRDFNVDQEYFQKLKALYEHFRLKEMARFYSIKSENGEPAASILFFYFRDTIYFYLGLLNPQFKDFPVKPFLIDMEIEKNCQKYKTFDFQGSMIPGVESFVRSFGAVPVPYLNISRKKFPFNLIY